MISSAESLILRFLWPTKTVQNLAFFSSARGSGSIFIYNNLALILYSQKRQTDAVMISDDMLIL